MGYRHLHLIQLWKLRGCKRGRRRRSRRGFMCRRLTGRPGNQLPLLLLYRDPLRSYINCCPFFSLLVSIDFIRWARCNFGNVLFGGLHLFSRVLLLISSICYLLDWFMNSGSWQIAFVEYLVSWIILLSSGGREVLILLIAIFSCNWLFFF